MGNVDSIPEPLIKAYYELLKEEVVTRIRKDEDYVNNKMGQGSTHYDYLDKL